MRVRLTVIGSDRVYADPAYYPLRARIKQCPRKSRSGSPPGAGDAAAGGPLLLRSPACSAGSRRPRGRAGPRRLRLPAARRPSRSASRSRSTSAPSASRSRPIRPGERRVRPGVHAPRDERGPGGLVVVRQRDRHRRRPPISSPGDRVWWDRHPAPRARSRPWSARSPSRSARAAAGQRFPVVIECATASAARPATSRASACARTSPTQPSPRSAVRRARTCSASSSAPGG